MPTSAKRQDSSTNLRVVPATRPPRAPRKLGVLDEIRLALHPRNRAAAVMGAVLGGGAPVATYWLAHHELDRGLAVWALVAGGLLFSATTVARWASSAFGSQAKALGFTVLLEGVLLYSRTGWLAAAALVYLVGINAISTGVQLAIEGRTK